MKKGVKSISGATELKVNEWQTYTVKEWYSDTPTSERKEANVKWAVYYLNNGVPNKILEKTEGKIRFQEAAIGKSYLIVAYVYDAEISTGLKVTVIGSEKKEISSIEVSSKSKKIAYGSTLDVKVQTVGMQSEYLELSLYEDDANGKGHNSINEKNLLKKRNVQVGSNGIAMANFLLEPDFEKIANAYNKSEGSQHEFYVTAYHLGSLKASSDNINVANPKHVEVRKDETTKVIKGQQPPKPKPVQPYKAKAGTPKPATASGISKVTLVKNGSKKLSATIYSSGLIGKTVRFKVMEEDTFSNDLLVNEKITIKSDVHKKDILLSTIPASLGGTSWDLEGSEQELFVDVEVLETKTHIVSKTVDVDISEFKVDISENKTVTAVKEGKKPEEPKKEKGKCYCNRDLTLQETTDIIKKLRDSETSVKKASGYSLFGANNCKLNAQDKTIEKFNTELNKIFNKYKINTCIRKIHFLSQVYLETDRFRTTKEYATNGEYKPYVGRGLMQLTWKSNYVIYKAYSKVDCVTNYELIANNLKNAFDSAGWYWKQGKVLSVGQRWTGPKKAPTYVKIHKPDYPKTTIKYIIDGETKKYGTVDLSLIADDDRVDIISYLVNGGSNGLVERRNYVLNLKNIFKYPQICINKNGGVKSVGNSTGVTIRLKRKWQTNNSTIGEFTIDDSEVKGFILEEKGPDTTVSGIEQRVPIGTYNLEWHYGTKIKKGLKLFNNQVSKSRAILIHGGNKAEDTEGCLLPGTTRSKDFVGQSQAKLKEIFDIIEEKGIDGAKIIITEAYV